ncbi:AMP-binding protein [Roseomonas sp. CCTCC AB2023176]|uniref:fatty acyl-AMP ligase n=1 Tax=Roseomonas sp. CCTCC AB2023176 TaxID=3342640 RepID=UPI0035E1503F
MGEQPGAAGSIIDLLRGHATERGGQVALADALGEPGQGLTYAGLMRAAESAGALLATRAAAGDRVLLVFSSGSECVVAFLGCLLAGLVPVPVMPPRRGARRDAGMAIARDCGARLAVLPADASGRPDAGLAGGFVAAGIECLSVPMAADAAGFARPAREVAFLQYSSGSTAAPKGVVVTQAALMANLAMIRSALGTGPASRFVSWLPLHHDMGLILNVLHALHAGATIALMPPARFMHRPLSWLHAIARHGADIAAAPNFALDLCVDRLRPSNAAGLDLSGWTACPIGGEPIRAATLRRFAAAFAPCGFDARALLPGYGLAEATVLASLSVRGRGAVLLPADEDREEVACGAPVAPGEAAIVDADGRRAAEGEIWLRGPHVARGYWGRPEESAAAFGQRIAGEAGAGWLRTGDLGRLGPRGEIIVAGRAKDLVIIRGTNHHPQDIEVTAAASHPALRRDGGAAFGAAGPKGEEVLVIVQEVLRTRRDVDEAALLAAVTEAVVTEHGVAPHAVAFIREGTLPRTTSGKIRRGEARRQWLQGPLVPWTASVAPGQGAPGQGAPGQGAPGQGAPGQGAPGQGAPGQGAPGQGAMDQGAIEQGAVAP